MARNLCLTCQRPLNACICAFIDNINNKTPVLVLQHPSEVQQSKGTVALLQRSLNSCQVIVGEDFSDNVELNRLLQHYQALLLYPSEKSQVITLTDSHNHSPLSTSRCHEKSQLLIIIDGTWQQARKIYNKSPYLQKFKHYEIQGVESAYSKRRNQKNIGLCTAEVTIHLLAKYKHSAAPLLSNKFIEFNQ